MPKKNVTIFFLAIVLLFLLCSCAKADEASDVATSVTPPTASDSETPAGSPNVPTRPSNPQPPLIPEEERRYIYAPYLVKLEPYINGSYTDGYTTYVFQDDGAVLCNYPSGATSGSVFTIEKKDIEKPLIVPEIFDTDEFKVIYEKTVQKVSEIVGYDFDLDWNTIDYHGGLIHKDGGDYYIHIDLTGGGGSGESYYHADGSIFLKVNAEGDTVDYGMIRAMHIVWYGGYFYYVELVDQMLSTPGVGKIIRMDMDGSNKKTIISEPVYGPFQITHDRIYYSSLADGKAYSTDLSGENKTPVGSHITPDNHRVWVDFYDDMIISKFWSLAGYSVGIFVFPGDFSGPAIMDINGNNLLTFPAELSGDNTYEVINWGRDNTEYESYTSYLFLKSNYDGSYWVYSKRHYSQDSPFLQLYEWGWEQWVDKALK